MVCSGRAGGALNPKPSTRSMTSRRCRRGDEAWRGDGCTPRSAPPPSLASTCWGGCPPCRPPPYTLPCSPFRAATPLNPNPNPIPPQPPTARTCLGLHQWALSPMGTHLPTPTPTHPRQPALNPPPPPATPPGLVGSVPAGPVHGRRGRARGARGARGGGAGRRRGAAVGGGRGIDHRSHLPGGSSSVIDQCDRPVGSLISTGVPSITSKEGVELTIAATSHRWVTDQWHVFYRPNNVPPCKRIVTHRRPAPRHPPPRLPRGASRPRHPTRTQTPGPSSPLLCPPFLQPTNPTTQPHNHP